MAAPRHIYVAGPISSDPMGGARRAMEAGAELMAGGLVPFVPHLSILWEISHPRSYEEWMSWDFAWLSRCDALYRVPGKSSGADREVEFARELGIPVFFEVVEAVAWARGEKGAA
jgi:hypothetical protein